MQLKAKSLWIIFMILDICYNFDKLLLKPNISQVHTLSAYIFARIEPPEFH